MPGGFFCYIIGNIKLEEIRSGNMLKIKEQIETFQPYNEQEKQDKKVLLKYLEHGKTVFTREDETAHMTASAWVVNQDRTKVLMIYHNIYDSWAWTGGHADGETDLLAVAVREVKEETGIQMVKPVTEEILSLEILPVAGHVKHGKYVSSHLHLNITYLLETDDKYELAVKPDENSGVKWFTPGGAIQACSEPWMRAIYQKLNEKCGLTPKDMGKDE